MTPNEDVQTLPLERNGNLKRRRKNPLSNPEVNRYKGLHAPTRMEGRFVCVLCQALNHLDRAQAAAQGEPIPYKKPSRSKFKCEACNVSLCFQNRGGYKSCFEHYHTDKSIEGIDYNVRKSIRQKN